MNNEDFYGNLYLVNQDKSQVAYELSEKYTKIGRHKKQCLVCIENPNVELTHCIIEYDKTCHFVKVTNNSLKDIYINETRLASKQDCPLRDQDTIYFKDVSGETTLCFLYKANMNFFKRDKIDAGTKDEVLVIQNDLQDLFVDERSKKDNSKSKYNSISKDLKSGAKSEEKNNENQTSVTKNDQYDLESKEALEKSQTNEKGSNQQSNKQDSQENNSLFKRLANNRFCS